MSQSASDLRIDLHLHTTASDGRLSPSELVALARDVDLQIISVTDHDTVAGLDEARRAAEAIGVRLVDGIEVTAVDEGRDVHVLGYFFDPDNPELARFLQQQRLERVDRVREIGTRLATLGCPVDVESLLAAAAKNTGRSVGRPMLADALVAAGHAADRREAFDRWLGNERPAFVARCGPGVSDVVAILAGAGGIASLAHPGLLRADDRIPGYARCGLTALEARHREHTPDDELRYRAMAAELGLAVSGGSDFHGPYEGRDGRPSSPGSVTLAPEEFAVLESRARADHDAPRRPPRAQTSA